MKRREGESTCDSMIKFKFWSFNSIEEMLVDLFRCKDFLIGEFRSFLYVGSEYFGQTVDFCFSVR